MLDIEGGEIEALKGARRFLSAPAQEAPEIIFEIHRSYVDWSEGLAKTPICSLLIERGYEPMAISAVAGTNVRDLLYRASELLAETPAEAAAIEVPVYRPEEDPREFTIQEEDGSWRVKGVSIERAAAMTYWEYEQSVRRFQRILETIGIDKALRDKGVEPGDTVLIGEHELEWED